ncbi:type II secretion system protein [Acidobacteriota bacterium]
MERQGNKRTARGSRAGFTLVELVVTVAIIAVLTAAAIPMAKISVKRSKEIELKRNLRTIRRAIDDFHKSYVISQATAGSAGKLPGTASNVQWSSTGPGGRGRQTGRQRSMGTQQPGRAGQQVQIPGVTEQEVPTVPLIDISRFDPIDSKGYPPDLETLVEGVESSGNPDDKVKFLRRIPNDPMTSEGEWAFRSYQDRKDSLTWGRQNVYDVYSKSNGTALDGTRYKDW